MSESEKRISGLREFIELAEKAVEIERLGLAWRDYDISKDECVFRLGVNRWQDGKFVTAFTYNDFTVACHGMLGIKLHDGTKIDDDLSNAKLRLVAELAGQGNPIQPRNDESTNIPKEVKSMVIFKDVLHVATTDGVFAKDRDGKFQRIFTP